MLKQKIIKNASGGWIIHLSFWGFWIFLTTTILALLWPDNLQLLNIITTLILFGIGFLAFTAAFFIAAQRSRYEILSIASIYFLSKSAPKQIAFFFRGLLTSTSVLALTAAGIRPFTGQAFGILTPLFILGLMGLWGAKCGDYPLIKNKD